MRFFFRLIYGGFSFLLIAILQLHFLYRSIRYDRRYLKNFGERYGVYNHLPVRQRTIWLHASSLGEVNSVVSLVLELRQRFSQYTWVVTCMTPAGRERAKEKFGHFADVVYMPFDIASVVNCFLKKFNPYISLLVESELWPGLIVLSANFGCYVFIVNSRVSDRSWIRYQLILPFIRYVLDHCQASFAQGSLDAQRFRYLGVPYVYNFGNLKYDFLIDPYVISQGKQWRLSVKRPQVVVLCSIHWQECVSLFPLLKSYAWTKDVLFVLLPRYLETLPEIIRELDTAGLLYTRRSQFLPFSSDVWVVDSYGEALSCLAMADVAFVGGSLYPYGGHNIIEACALLVPVVVGPFTFNFTDICSSAIAIGAARCVQDAHGLCTALYEILHHPQYHQDMTSACERFVSTHAGALQKSVDFISDFLHTKH